LKKYINKIITNNYLDCLKYLHEQGCSFNFDEPIYFDTNNENLDCLKYLHEHGVPLNENLFIIAFQDANLNWIKYLHEHGCPLPTNIYSYIASREELYYSSSTCTNPNIEQDLIECLKYLHENITPWTIETYRYVLYSRNSKCFKYLIQNGCPSDESILNEFNNNDNNYFPPYDLDYWFVWCK